MGTPMERGVVLLVLCITNSCSAYGGGQEYVNSRGLVWAHYVPRALYTVKDEHGHSEPYGFTTEELCGG